MDDDDGTKVHPWGVVEKGNRSCFHHPRGSSSSAVRVHAEDTPTIVLVEAEGHLLHGDEDDEDGTVAAAADDDRVVVGGNDGEVAADTEMIVADAGDIPAVGLVASSSSNSAVVKVHDDDDDKEHASAAGDAAGGEEEEEEPADSPNFHCYLLHDDDEAEHAADTSKGV